jgi:hypothetical protein
MREKVFYLGNAYFEEMIMDDEKGQPVDGKILELARAIMERAPELRIKNEEADQAFEKKLEDALLSNNSSSPHAWMEECSAWCAHHGPIGMTTRILLLYKMILDHEQSIPGHHAIRMHCEEIG